VTTRNDAGNGDLCPLDPAHGHMVTIKKSDPPRQWCPDQSHDGRPETHPQGSARRSRAFWPLYDLEAAIRSDREPETVYLPPIVSPLRAGHHADTELTLDTLVEARS
jgi:hypothetical protein